MGKLIWGNARNSPDLHAFQGRRPLHRSDRTLLPNAVAKRELSQRRRPRHVVDRLVKHPIEGHNIYVEGKQAGARCQSAD